MALRMWLRLSRNGRLPRKPLHRPAARRAAVVDTVVPD